MAESRQTDHRRKLWRENALRHRVAIRAFIWRWKETHACVDCGEADPVCLDFDHRDPKQKKFQICDAADKRVKLSALQAEIDKCDMRCANCHRKKTFIERIVNDLVWGGQTRARCA